MSIDILKVNYKELEALWGLNSETLKLVELEGVDVSGDCWTT